MNIKSIMPGALQARFGNSQFKGVEEERIRQRLFNHLAPKLDWAITHQDFFQNYDETKGNRRAEKNDFIAESIIIGLSYLVGQRRPSSD